jgi:hypothetical protein
MPAPLLRINQAVTDETAIDGGAPGKGIDPFAGQVVTDGPRTPERMGAPEIQDPGFDRRRHLMRTGVRPGRVVDETAQALAGIVLEPAVHGLAGHAIAQGDVGDPRPVQDLEDRFVTLFHQSQPDEHGLNLPR